MRGSSVAFLLRFRIRTGTVSTGSKLRYGATILAYVSRNICHFQNFLNGSHDFRCSYQVSQIDVSAFTEILNHELSTDFDELFVSTLAYDIEIYFTQIGFSFQGFKNSFQVKCSKAVELFD